MGLGYRAFVSEATGAVGAIFRLATSRIGRGKTPDRAAGHAPFSGKVWVVDGGTVVVNRIRVCLAGIEAPGLSQYGGRRAKSHLIGLAGGRHVEVEPEGIDCYGRVLARVRLGEVDLAACMVRDGFAQGERNGRYSQASAEARLAGEGLWASAGGRGQFALDARRTR